MGLADVLQLGKACQQATKSQLRVSPAILGRGVQNILENDELAALPGRTRAGPGGAVCSSDSVLGGGGRGESIIHTAGPPGGRS